MGENIGEKTIRYYWKKMTQLKFDLTYFGLHFKSCVFWLRFISIGSAVLSALATGAWLEWHETKWIGIACPIVIIVLQALSAGSTFLPFDDRKIDLREMIDLLDPLYDDMEQKWERIVVGELTKEEIQEATQSYQSRITDIKSRFLKNDSLPDRKRLTSKAVKDCDAYFKNLRR